MYVSWADPPTIPPPLDLVPHGKRLDVPPGALHCVAERPVALLVRFGDIAGTAAASWLFRIVRPAIVAHRSGRMLQRPRHPVGGADDRQRGGIPRVTLREILRWSAIACMLLAVLILGEMLRLPLSLRFP
jgi:hypothetical protein